jgi:hypothetical protein
LAERIAVVAAVCFGGEVKAADMPTSANSPATRRHYWRVSE